MLSLSMIVRDEEQKLGTCLESVKGFCDELVVVDTGSTDNTIAIAKDAGARVEEIEWPGDFTPARNKALEFVSGDWVLVLDADEQLIALNRLVGVVVHGSPYLWDSLKPLLPRRCPAAYSAGQMQEAQRQVLTKLVPRATPTGNSGAFPD